MFHYLSSTCQQWNKSLKSLWKARKKQTKNKEKERSLQKSSLKEFRKMRKEQESIIQMFNQKGYTFSFSNL